MQFSAQIKCINLSFLRASLAEGTQWPGVQVGHLVALGGRSSPEQGYLSISSDFLMTYLVLPTEDLRG